MLHGLALMHATEVTRPLNTKGWIYEEKYDGTTDGECLRSRTPAACRSVGGPLVAGRPDTLVTPRHRLVRCKSAPQRMLSPWHPQCSSTGRSPCPTKGRPVARRRRKATGQVQWLIDGPPNEGVPLPRPHWGAPRGGCSPRSTRDPLCSRRAKFKSRGVD